VQKPLEGLLVQRLPSVHSNLNLPVVPVKITRITSIGGTVYNNELAFDWKKLSIANYLSLQLGASYHRSNSYSTFDSLTEEDPRCHSITGLLPMAALKMR
jgi:hypothetical protein